MRRPTESAAAVLVAVQGRPTFEIPLGLLRPSSLRQPRSMSFDVSDIQPSMAEHGLLHPIWVRTRPLDPPDPELGDKVYEIIIGERRSLSATNLKWPTITAEIRDDLTDLDIFLIQLEENAKRRNLSPLEEADALARLMAPESEGGFGITDTAELSTRLQITVPTVYQRIALAAASSKVRDALDAGVIFLGSAMAIAGLHDTKAQEECLDECIPPDGEEPYPVRRVQRLVQDRYHLRLAQAPFDIAAADLLPGTPACGACPKRAGSEAQLSLFVAGAIVTPPSEDERCTDRACFARKRTAWKDRQVEAARTRGHRVIDGAEGADMYPAGRFVPSRAAGLIDLDEKPIGGNGKTYRELLGNDVTVEAVVVDKDERVHDLADRTKVRAALTARGVLALPEPSSTPEKESKAASKPEDKSTAPLPEKADDGFTLQRQAEEEAGLEALAEVARIQGRRSITAKFLRFALRAVVVLAGPRIEHVVERRGLRTKDTPKSTSDQELVLELIGQLDEGELGGLLAELAASIDGLHPGSDEGHALTVACRFYGLDLDALVKGHAKRLKKTSKRAGEAAPKDQPAKAETGSAKKQRTPGTCSACGCTNDKPCETKNGDACVWATTDETLCSVCGNLQAMACEVIEDGIRSPTLDELVPMVIVRIDDGEIAEAERDGRIRKAISDGIDRKKLVQDTSGRFRQVARVAEKPATAGATPSDPVPTTRERIVLFLRSAPEQKAHRRELLDALKKHATASAILREVALMTTDKLVESGDGSVPIRLVAPTYDEVQEQFEGLKLAEVRARYEDVLKTHAPAMGIVELRHRLAVRLSGEAGTKKAASAAVPADPKKGKKST